MDDKAYGRERCRQARLERLQSNNPSCMIDGEKDPSVLQRHHPGGQKYTEETVILCLNHHRKAEELRKDHPPDLAGPPSELEREGRLLLGISDLLSLNKNPSPETIHLIQQTALRLIERGERSRAGY